MKKIFIWFCLVLMIVAGCRSQQITEPPVTVLKDGKSSFQIVLPDQYDNAGTETHLLTAAKCLQKEFQAASGVLLPIRKESSMEPNRPSIFIGNTGMTRKAGFEPASFRDFSYVIAAKNGKKEDTVGEISDLLYHLTVMMVNENIPLDDVRAELNRRHGKTGNLKTFHKVDHNT